MAIPAVEYYAEWLSPVSGKVLKSETITAKASPVDLTAPKFNPDIVLRVKRIKSKYRESSVAKSPVPVDTGLSAQNCPRTHHGALHTAPVNYEELN